MPYYKTVHVDDDGIVTVAPELIVTGPNVPALVEAGME
jgi:hypothetical protein